MYHDDVAAQAAERARHRENSARLATAYTTFSTSGQGSVQFADRCDFGVTFISKPFFWYGAEIDLDELGDAQNVDGGEMPVLPHTSGYVVDWDIDDRGFYTGAWCAAKVSYAFEELVDISLAINVTHVFSFQAIAMKDIPIDFRD